MVDTNQIVHASYSSVTDEVDFCAPALMYAASYEGASGLPFPGTSCSAPVLCGMAALVNDFFIGKTGKPLSSQMMYRFLADCAKDAGDAGKDPKYGWGAPILPDPASVDIWNYWEASEMDYTDKDSISGWAAESVSLLSGLGIMQGNADGEFMPKDTVTREQLAVALANLYRKLAG